MSRSAQISGIGMHLKVRDITASRDFYEGVLQFVPVFAYGDDAFLSTIPDGVATAPERYHGVTYEPVPNCPFEIADGHIAVTDPHVFTDLIETPKQSAMIRVASLVPFLADGGVRPKFPVRRYYWGTIELALRDPDGFVLILIAPFSEGEIDAVRSYVPVDEISAAGSV